MTTKFIGMKEFRQNIATYTKQAKMKNIQFIILKKNVPVLEVKPVDEKKFAMERLAEKIKEAREDVKHRRVYTEDQMYKLLGLSKP